MRLAKAFCLRAFQKIACVIRGNYSIFTMDFIRDVADLRWIKELLAARNSMGHVIVPSDGVVCRLHYENIVPRFKASMQ